MPWAVILLFIYLVFPLLAHSQLYEREVKIVPEKLTFVSQIFNSERGYKLVQILPNLNENPVDSSLVYFGYTPEELVIFVKNWQKEINASSMRRDAEGIAMQKEDAIYILLSTQGKGKDSYWIGVNPLGTILDKMMSKAGVTEWDGDIKAEAKRTEYGWIATVIIPFKSITYIQGDWGIQIMRVIYNKLELQFLKPTTDFGNLIESVADISVSFDYIKKASDYIFFFVSSGRYENVNRSAKLSGSGTFRFKKGESDLVDVTYNPDFSEVDVDIQQFRIDRLPVDYPEKRTFFIEGRSYLNMPVSLVRTRNILQPEYGLKLYSVTEKSSFIAYYLVDTLYRDIGFGRFIYSPFKQTNLGLFFLTSKINYNLISSDFTYYFEKFKTRLQIQGARETSGGSNLYYISLFRQVARGFSSLIEFRQIDANFVSPLNRITLNFDDIREYNAVLNYSYYKMTAGKTLFFQPQLYLFSMFRRSDASTVYSITGGSIIFGIVPLLFSVDFSSSRFDYLSFLNNRVKTLTLGLRYEVSAWKSLAGSYTFGDYLGGRISQLVGEIKFSLFDFFNLGFTGYRVKSSARITAEDVIDLDNLTVLQFYGEVQVFLKDLIFKPYLSYEVDNLRNNKRLILNGILIFEPSARYLTGVYLAFNRRYSGSQRLLKVYNKEVFKFQIGLKF